VTGPLEPDTSRPAGRLSVWIGEITSALREGSSCDVPCAGCVACCSAAQFVHVGPDETNARAAIPTDLLFTAPGLPAGHHLMGYDAKGRCPMLGESGCTIYADRPRACRVYDCRVFAATGVVPDEPGRAQVAARAAGWRFAVESPEEQLRWNALHEAARVVASLPEGRGRGSTAVALAALRIHGLFIEDGQVVAPSTDRLRAELSAPPS
jgi:Fe-S-cluster containining protein